MSGASSSTNPSTKKAIVSDKDTSKQPPAVPAEKPPPVMDEDDEFEDFPVEDWPDEETELANGDAASGKGGSNHLWEESWDDDDTSGDFASVLKEELRKVDEAKGK